ncbi:hypothetical protein Pan44_35350 [Caulifigura coniformis]|uniref:Uncharacterized protein n=1 Tax=Caulifigura coniformis TaxID=2527983 RepID=A0A517SH87_9PLAN|nr:hypothetical protein [Caulifigura coniformis]QDT55491.1 hypothetical protein Pan44_35350 [Caulifigura coniformis]
MILDSRLTWATLADGQGVVVFKPRRRTAPTLELLKPTTDSDIADVAKLMGHEPTAVDIARGAADRKGYERHAEISARVRRDAERNGPVVEPTPEEQKLAFLRAKVDDERRAKLTTAERLLEDAEREAARNKAAAEQEAARAAIRETDGYKALRQQLDDAIFVATYSKEVSQPLLDEIVHQSEMLERFLDVPTALSNVAKLRDAARAEVEPERLQLQTAQDALARRAAILGSGVFSEAVPVMVGDKPYIRLTRNGQTIAISRERYEGRVSDEALASQVFTEGGNV